MCPWHSQRPQGTLPLYLMGDLGGGWMTERKKRIPQCKTLALEFDSLN